MRQLGSATLVVLLLGMLPAWSQEEPTDCQYVLVADQCKQQVYALDVGNGGVRASMTLDFGNSGNFALGGVDFTTVPGPDEFFAFVAQGPLLHVVDIRWSEPEKTIDLEQTFDLENLVLNRIHAAAPVTVNQRTRYPLYAIGALAGAPWVLVFDQESLLSDSSNPNDLLLASGPIHADCGDCAAVPLDIVAGGPPAGGGIQEAYASVLDKPDSDMWLRVYRIVLYEDFSFDVFLDPWNDEGLPWDGSAYRANGLDYDSTGTQPFGVFQTTAVVKDLSNGEGTCELPGHPNDVAVWGPDSGMAHPDFQFVTSVTPVGADLLLGFPAGGCPDGGAASLSFPIADFPRALALSSVTSNTPWIYTANRYESITAVHLALSSDAVLGDRIDVIESFVVPVGGGCPYALAIRDETYDECVLEFGEPAESKPPPVDCITDPEDPRCNRVVLGTMGGGSD